MPTQAQVLLALRRMYGQGGAQRSRAMAIAKQLNARSHRAAPPPIDRPPPARLLASSIADQLVPGIGGAIGRVDEFVSSLPAPVQAFLPFIGSGAISAIGSAAGDVVGAVGDFFGGGSYTQAQLDLNHALALGGMTPRQAATLPPVRPVRD
ncbi:MAG TPA: hypothetical protein VE008_14130 [Burkholderiales bacterium]|nr:hypothetical protein [Burkholderiales bacterium]